MNARVVLLAVMALGGVATLRAQTIQNPTLRRAQQAFDNLDYRQALSAGQAALRERLTGFERARAYELLGFTYSGMDSILKAVDARCRGCASGHVADDPYLGSGTSLKDCPHPARRGPLRRFARRESQRPARRLAVPTGQRWIAPDSVRGADVRP